MTDDLRVCLQALEGDGSEIWRYGAEKSRGEVNELLCGILSGRESSQHGESEGVVPVLHRSSDDEQQLDEAESDLSDDDDFWSAGAPSDLFVGRVNALVEVLVDMGCD